MQLGGKVLTLSDSEGFIHDPDGITQDKIDWVKVLKTKRRGRIVEYVKEFKGATFTGGGATPWGVKCDVALPCATQNELNGADAETLVKNGCIAVSEGANMPTDLDGIARLQEGPHPLRAGQGRQCRRRCGVRPGDEPRIRAAAPGRKMNSSSC